MLMLKSKHMFHFHLYLIVLLGISGIISILTLAGIALVIGSYWIYFGNIKYSTVMYLFADLGWLLNALQQEDIVGAISVGIGIFVGITVMYKIHSGIFVQNLKIDKEKK